MPAAPRPLSALLDELASERLVEVLRAQLSDDGYLPWDKLRRRPAPAGFTHEEWWVGLKLQRNLQRRELPFVDVTGKHF